MRMVAAFVALGAAAGTAVAQDSVADRPASKSWTKENGTIGLMADVGVPDGATASLVVRPLRPLRIEAGVAHNSISPGLRGGLTWVVFDNWVTPVVGVSYGKFREGNANTVIQQVSGDDSLSSPLLEKVGYSHASARLGLELGKKYFTFFIHAGMSRVNGTVHNIDRVTEETMESQVSVTTTDPKIQATGVSANLGFIIYLH